MAGHLLLPLIVVATLAIAPRLYRLWYLPDNSWRSYDAQVLGTRLVPTGPVDYMYGGYVLYRVEIHAAWTQDGTAHDAWVPTTKTGGDYAWLSLWATQQTRRCIVRESPSNPSARLAYFGN